jgi:UDP-GlcNAc:undecaprenyl-phosphate GlcNAc-1-phosphate transferase
MTTVTFRVLFLAACLALLAGPFASRLTKRMRLLDIPGREAHKVHASPTPIAGGMVIFFALVVTTLLEPSLRQSNIWTILLSGAVVFLFGLWDDFRCLPAWLKFAGQILAAGLMIALGVQVRLFQQEFLNWGLTIFWLVGITNAYNFVDSMDGLATGLAGLASAFFLLVTYDSGQHDLSLLSGAILGACVGSFLYNSSPARFFLGDSGAQLLGFLLAALAIAYAPVGLLRSQSWYVPILLVGIPIFDTVLVVFSRFRRKLPIYQARRDHTYHRLVCLGIDSNRAVVSMHVAALLLGCVAFIALPLPPVAGNSIFAACLLGSGYLVLYLDDRKRWP